MPQRPGVDPSHRSPRSSPRTIGRARSTFRGKVLDCARQARRPRAGDDSCSRHYAEPAGRVEAQGHRAPDRAPRVEQAPYWPRSRRSGSRPRLSTSTSFASCSRARTPRSPSRVKAIWGTIRDRRNPERERVVDQIRKLARTRPRATRSPARLSSRSSVPSATRSTGEGQDVGPDITSNGRNDFDQLLSNVFDPSLVIGPGYQATTVATTEGRVLTGLLVEDGKDRVVLKLQAEARDDPAQPDRRDEDQPRLAHARGDREAARAPGDRRPVRVPLPRQAPLRSRRQAPAGRGPDRAAAQIAALKAISTRARTSVGNPMAPASSRRPRRRATRVSRSSLHGRKPPTKPIDFAGRLEEGPREWVRRAAGRERLRQSRSMKADDHGPRPARHDREPSPFALIRNVRPVDSHDAYDRSPR